MNNYGQVVIVSVKRANEMLTAVPPEGRLVNEPDMLPGDPIDMKSSRRAPINRLLVRPTASERQDDAALFEEKERLAIEERVKREADIAKLNTAKEEADKSKLEADKAKKDAEKALAKLKKAGPVEDNPVEDNPVEDNPVDENKTPEGKIIDPASIEKEEEKLITPPEDQIVKSSPKEKSAKPQAKAAEDTNPPY